MINALLWVLQGILALFCVMGSVWRFMNYEQTARDVASMQALPFAVWNAIGAFEVVCALALLLPGIFQWKPSLTSYAALGLTVEMLLLTGLHASFFGLNLRATNPAVWTMVLAVFAAVIVYGRFTLRPL